MHGADYPATVSFRAPWTTRPGYQSHGIITLACVVATASIVLRRATVVENRLGAYAKASMKSSAVALSVKSA
ncbi:hypothetical protein F5B20DRAFT_581540 [Whalleya microplaca]|nr:hypothetical protein F5B20DRAFT_581540 [Whalleya microplaca]